VHVPGPPQGRERTPRAARARGVRVQVVGTAPGHDNSLSDDAQGLFNDQVTASNRPIDHACLKTLTTLVLTMLLKSPVKVTLL